jgi:hypothetical protein
LPWLNDEIECGRLKVKARQARSYMQLAANWQRAANLTEAPSIRAALELLSDKEPAAEQALLIPVDAEAERQARPLTHVPPQQALQPTSILRRFMTPMRCNPCSAATCSATGRTVIPVSKSIYVATHVLLQRAVQSPQSVQGGIRMIRRSFNRHCSIANRTRQ